VGLTSAFLSALCGAAEEVTAGAAGLVSVLAGSAANADTTNNDAIKVAIDFILKFPF
jgi:hypothetical protein